MRPYMQTLARLAREFAEARTIYGGHGPIVGDAPGKDRRVRRAPEDARGTDRRRAGERSAHDPELVREIYSQQRVALWPAMARQILAHLLALVEEGRVTSSRRLGARSSAEFEMLNPKSRRDRRPRGSGLLEAELGTQMRLESLDEYRLAGGGA